MSKIDFFAKTINCFSKRSILEVYWTDSPKFVSHWEIHLMNTKTKTTYINYIHKLHKLNYIKLHLLLVFVKCALMTTHSYQIEMYSLRLIYIIRMQIQAKINEAVKYRNIFFTQSLMLPNIFRAMFRIFSFDFTKRIAKTHQVLNNAYLTLLTNTKWETWLLKSCFYHQMASVNRRKHSGLIQLIQEEFPWVSFIYGALVIV